VSATKSERRRLGFGASASRKSPEAKCSLYLMERQIIFGERDICCCSLRGVSDYPHFSVLSISPVLLSMSKVCGVGFPPVASNYCCSQPSQGSLYSIRALIQYIISLLPQVKRFLVSRSAQYIACLQEFKNPHEVVYLHRKAFKGRIDFRPVFPSLHNPYGTVDPF
jgi:hypothetical protein